MKEDEGVFDENKEGLNSCEQWVNFYEQPCNCFPMRVIIVGGAPHCFKCYLVWGNNSVAARIREMP